MNCSVTRILAEEIQASEVPMYISKLKRDALKHGYAVQGFFETYFMFWGEHGYLTKIDYNSLDSNISEIHIERVKRID